MSVQPNAWGHIRDSTNMKDNTHQAHSAIPTRRIWSDDYDGQMILGDLGGLKFPNICLTGEEKPRKKPHPGNLSRPGIEPGPAAYKRAYYHLLHSGGPKTNRSVIGIGIDFDICP